MAAYDYLIHAAIKFQFGSEIRNTIEYFILTLPEVTVVGFESRVKFANFIYISRFDCASNKFGAVAKNNLTGLGVAVNVVNMLQLTYVL